MIALLIGCTIGVMVSTIISLSICSHDLQFYRDRFIYYFKCRKCNKLTKIGTIKGDKFLKYNKFFNYYKEVKE